MIYTVMDETSYMGMRNQHWLSGDPFNSREVLKEIIDKGGKIAVWFEWVDKELGDHHMFVAWRLRMLGEKIWAISVEKHDYENEKEFADRVSWATMGYKERFNETPNRVIIRKNGNNLGKKEILLVDDEEAEAARLKVVEVETGWQEGVLGVYFDGGGVDG